MRNLSIILVMASFQLACGSSDAMDMGSTDPLAGTVELAVPVPDSGRIYVNLAQPAVITVSGDPKSSAQWDLAFEGYDVYTNSGVSGSGQGGAFGPLDQASSLGATAPSVPFISADKAGGAFLDWYAYDGSMHILYSRFHVFGVKDAARLWKVQILTYYGVKDNAPTSGLYQIRYAEIGSGVGATQELNVDGTAGGQSGTASAPSGCLDLASGKVSLLTGAQAQASSAWDLCFHRDAISVNGEVGGPRGVGAVDLEASQTAGEQLTAVKAKTAAGERPLFDGVGAPSFASARFRGDHVVSAFESGGWVDHSQSPPPPAADQYWLVVDASGQHKFIVSFKAFQNATTSSPGTVVAHIKPVRG